MRCVKCGDNSNQSMVLQTGKYRHVCPSCKFNMETERFVSPFPIMHAEGLPEQARQEWMKSSIIDDEGKETCSETRNNKKEGAAVATPSATPDVRKSMSRENSEDAIVELSMVPVVADYITKNIKREDYDISYNYRSIKLSKSGNSKLQSFIQTSGYNTEKNQNGRDAIRILFLITIAVNHFSTVWRKKYQLVGSIVDNRLLKLLSYIIEANKANTSQKEITKQLDDYIGRSVFGQFNMKQHEDINRLFDLSGNGMGDKRVSTYMDSICDWRPTIIKCAYILGTTGLTNIVVKDPDANKSKQPPIDVNKIVDKHIGRLKIILVFNLLTVAIIFVMYVLSKSEIPPLSWLINGLYVSCASLSILNWLDEYSGYAKMVWTMAFGSILGVGLSLVSGKLLPVKVGEIAPRVLFLAMLPCVSVSVIRRLKDLKCSTFQLFVFRALSIIIYTSLAIMTLIGALKYINL